MIIVLHGEHVLASQKELDSLKLKFKEAEILTLDGAKTNLATIKQSLESLSLFGQDRLVIIENFLSGKNIIKNVSILKYFNSLPPKTNLVLWEKKEIGKRILDALSGVKRKHFPLSKSIFIFLESLKPGNTKTMLDLFVKTIGHESPDLVFYMITRQFINLLMVKELKNIPSLASWQVSRLIKQASYFTREQLIEIIKKLLIIEYELKKGIIDLSLVDMTEQLLFNL